MAKILIADDSATVREVLRDALANDGYEIYLASDGDEARSQIDKISPDVLLLDIEMPGSTGIDVLEHIKSSKVTQNISVIMVTSHTRDKEIVRALNAGAADYIVKPFSPEVVHARVRNTIRTRRLLTDLQTARAGAESANRSKSEFLANMSHEIRTPMTAIMGFADVLLGQVVKPENVSAARTIKRNGEYLLALINDILDLSKIEAGKLQIENTECSPAQVCAEVASLMQVRAEAKGIPLSIEYDGPIPRSIQSDPTRLRQILINLVGNAIKFTEVGSVRLVVRTRKDPSEAETFMEFDVIDSGIGMSDEQLKRLYRPFSQADASTTRKFGGTGLGLTISKRLAEALGGKLTCTSKPGVGSTFRLTVATGPIDNVPTLDDPNSIQIVREDADPQPLNVAELNCRILLAEDGPDNQRLISFILEKAGAEVALAENGQIALERGLTAWAEGRPFDLVLMDMQMPILDGYQATQKLREKGYPGPIVALTAHAMNEDRQKCINAGCDDFATKPIQRDKFLKMVGSYANPSAKANQDGVPMQAERLLTSLIESRAAESKGFAAERRWQPRTNMHLGVWVVPLVDEEPRAGEAFQAVTRDCSPGGMGLLATQLVSADEVLISLPVEKTSSLLRAKVRVRKHVGAGCYHIGTELVGMVERDMYPDLAELDSTTAETD